MNILKMLCNNLGLKTKMSYKIELLKLLGGYEGE